MFLEVIKKEFMQQWTYRANTILYLIGIVLQLLVQVSLWTYLDRQKPINDVSYNELMIYVILNIIINAVISSHVCNDLGEKVYNGSITIDIIRPMNIKSFMFGQLWGNILYRFIFCILPVTVTSGLILNVHFDMSAFRVVMFIVGLTNAAIIMFYINYILGLTAFWLQKIWFMYFYISGCMALFGGNMIPIWFYPSWLDQISRFLPFRYIVFEPINICIKYQDTKEIVGVLLMQLLWLSILFSMEQLIWRSAKQRIFVNGG